MKSVISVPIKDFIHHYPRALFNDIPRVGAHFYDIPVGAHFYDIPRSGRSLTTYPGHEPRQLEWLEPVRNAVLRLHLVGMQFYDMSRSGHSLMICPSRDAVFKTCPGQDAVLRHTRFGKNELS